MTSTVNAPPKPRSSLRSWTFQRVIAAEFISSVGTQMTTLALPWFVLITSGSPAKMGLVFVIQILPVPLLGIPAGLLVARWGARRVTVTGDFIDVALIGSVPLLHAMGLLSFPLLLVIVAGTGTVSAAYLSAQRVLISEAVGPDEAAATAGNAFFETATTSARLAGPAIAGFLIAAVGPLNVLWIDAVSFAVSACMLFGLPRHVTPEEPPKAGNVLEGVRFVFKDPVIRTVSLAALGYGALMPVVLLALPVLAKVSYGGNPHVAGWLLAAWGGGSAIGTLAVVKLSNRVSPVKLAVIGGIGAALALWFVPWHQPSFTLALAVGLSCMFLPGVTAPAVALLTLRPPEHLRAHVVPVFATAVFVASPIAYATAGLLFERFSPGAVLTGIAVGASLCALVLLSLIRRRAAAGDPSA